MMDDIVHKLQTCIHLEYVDLFSTYRSPDQPYVRRVWCRDCGATRIVILGEKDQEWQYPQWVQRIREGHS